ncbi:hypothetical protein G9A89_017766 [Geosiphon pyriformis]|nr:hypothetical protein G9A89_017766 [Geosiphon pyriformis]
MVREMIEKAIEDYLDTHRDNIRVHVEKNLNSTKSNIVEHLPDHVVNFLKSHLEKRHKESGGNFLGTIINSVSSLATGLSENFKNEIREATKHHVDKATEGSTDYITDTAVKESKVAVKSLTKKDDDDHKFFQNFDLSFLGEGKVGIVNKILELIRPPIRRVSNEIKEKVSSSFPKHIKKLILHDLGGKLPGSDKDGDGVNDNIQSVLALLGGGGRKKGGDGNREGGDDDDDDDNDFLDKILHRLPQKIHDFLTPFLEKFEEGLMQNISFELHNRIFSEDYFKKGVLSFLKLFGGSGGSGDGKGDGDRNLFGQVLGLFKKGKGDDDDD